MKIPFQSAFMLGIFDNFRDIPRGKIGKKHILALLFFACSIIFILIKISNLQFHKKEIESEKEKEKIENKLKSIDEKIRNIKLSRKEKELGLPNYHEANKNIKTYFTTMISKDSFFTSNDNKKFFLKAGTQSIVIQLNSGKKYYFYKNKILTKDEK
jgi:hypothetical protein